jgi:AAA family ATP:ADP antiporter
MFRTFSDVRTEERPGVVGAFLTLFGILAGHTLLETARDALFLARLPPSQLPWVYLAIAFVAVAFSAGSWKRPQGRYDLSLLLVGCALVTFAFWAFSSLERSAWTLYALYVWSGLVGTLTGLQFWLMLGELYTVTQAKRIYRVIGTGSLLGAVAGAAVARWITATQHPQSLVFAAALAFAATGLGPALLVRRPESPPHAPLGPAGGWRFAEALALFRGHGYVQGLGGLVLVSTVALTLADYVFKSTVARSVPSAELGTFFATFYTILNVLALLIQMFLMGWVFRRLGLHRALWVLPALVMLGSTGVALGGGVVAALLLKGADGTLRYSLHRTSIELLFLPLSDGLRSRAKPFIDVVGQRGGQALASLAILTDLGIRRGDAVLAGAAAALSVIWVAWAADLKSHYLELFRSALREGTLHDRADLPELDLGSLETLFGALNSRDDREVMGAMDVLAAEGRIRLIPALILYHPSQPVVLRALAHFERSQRTDFVPVADRLLSHADPEVRAAALRARVTVAPEESALRAAQDDPSALVRATALAGLVSGGWITDDAQRTLDSLVRGSAEAQLALGRAIERQPAAIFEEVLLELATTPDTAVRAQAAAAMGAVRSEAFFPALLSMLSERELRGAAREAFRSCGEAALRFLGSALDDAALPHEIRRHLPRTISQFPPAEAAGVLQVRLLKERDGLVRFKVVRGLGRLAADNPDLKLDGRVLREAIAKTLEAAFRLTHWQATLVAGAAAERRRNTPGHELLAALLRDKQVHTTERLFRLLGLLYRHEDFRNIYRGLRNTNAKVRASSRELLENTVRRPLRTAVLALVDDGPLEARMALARPFFTPVALDYEALLAALLEQPGESLRALAAYHVGELGLTALRGRLESIDPRATGLYVSHVVERALRMLEDAAKVAHAT